MRQNLVVPLLEGRADVDVFADPALDLVAEFTRRNAHDAPEDPRKVMDGLEADQLGDLLELVVGATDELLRVGDPTMRKVAHGRNAELPREPVADVAGAEAAGARHRGG